jgi:adenosylcobinamide-phosphate synthase
LLEYSWGYPPECFHPVMFLGYCISWGEQHLRSLAHSPRGLVWAGGVLAAAVVLGAFILPYAALSLLAGVFTLPALMLGIFLVYTVLATRSLLQHLGEVAHPLEAGLLQEARLQLGKIVGRDTSDLPPEEIARAAVETAAESLCDGVIAPLFYAFLGGAPLAWAYKAVNTLDSMVGYQDEHYLYLGRVPARLDDLANYLPARLTTVMLLLAGFLVGLNVKQGVRSVLADSGCQPSPNSGYPEGATAGLLGICLGGSCRYNGRYVDKPLLNPTGRKPRAFDIQATARLLQVAAVLFGATGLLLTALLRGI